MECSLRVGVVPSSTGAGPGSTDHRLHDQVIHVCMINLYMFANDARMVEEEGQRTYWIRSTLQLELVAEMPLAVAGIFFK